MGTLTVRENLRFSAALRLPSSVPQSEKEARVNHLIKELGLTKVADSKVNMHTCDLTTGTLLSASGFQSGRQDKLTAGFHLCVFSLGGHTDDPGNLWWREKEDKHWDGVDYWSLSSFFGWTNHWAGCQYSKLCPAVTKKVSNILLCHLIFYCCTQSQSFVYAPQHISVKM